jgi:hypothetical protein
MCIDRTISAVVEVSNTGYLFDNDTSLFTIGYGMSAGPTSTNFFKGFIYEFKFFKHAMFDNQLTDETKASADCTITAAASV